MKARNQARGRRGNVRFFAIPDLKLDAPSYFQVVDWPVWWSSGEDEPDNVADPPILIDLTDEEVESFAENTAPDKYQLPPIPCHSQAVERHVKLVSEAS